MSKKLNAPPNKPMQTIVAVLPILSVVGVIGAYFAGVLTIDLAGGLMAGVTVLMMLHTRRAYEPMAEDLIESFTGQLHQDREHR